MTAKKVKPWQSYYNRRDEVFSNPGSAIKQEWQLVIDSEGNESFVKSGETNLYEKIQTYKDSVDVNKIIKRVMSGDTSVLEQVKGFHADVSQMQTDFRELYNLNIRGQKLFDELPAEVKQLFDGSYYKFVTEPERLNHLNKKETTSVKKETTKVEEEETDE